MAPRRGSQCPTQTRPQRSSENGLGGATTTDFHLTMASRRDMADSNAGSGGTALCSPPSTAPKPGATSESCFASDFVRNMPVGNTQPLDVIRRRSSIKEVDGYAVRSESSGTSSPAVVGQREVRAVPVGGHRAGDATGGRRAVEGGPLDGGARVPHGQGQLLCESRHCASQREVGSLPPSDRVDGASVHAEEGGELPPRVPVEGRQREPAKRVVVRSVYCEYVPLRRRRRASGISFSARPRVIQGRQSQSLDGCWGESMPRHARVSRD